MAMLQMLNENAQPSDVHFASKALNAFRKQLKDNSVHTRDLQSLLLCTI
jgi:hypothetical protein